jgi:hypothetical protein
MFAARSARATPAIPLITEPATENQVISAYDVHMVAGPFVGAPGEMHVCTDWEIRWMPSDEVVWTAPCASAGALKVHIHLGDGTFVNTLAGQHQLTSNSLYKLRVRFQGDAAPVHGPGRRIQAKVASGQRGGPLACPPPQQRPRPGGKLVEGERLGQVVIGPGVQPADPVGHSATCREHEDRRPLAPLPQPAAQLEPVHVGQHDVKDNRVVRMLDRHPQALFTGQGHIDRIPLLLQPALEHRRHLHRILDHQKPHRTHP